MIFLAGPTCTGKTAVAVTLAKRLETEIISADSRQIYQKLNIGTAKPEGAYQKISNSSFFVYKGSVHHLIDFLDPKETYSAGDFIEQANTLVSSLKNKNKTPVIAGGTGLYIHSLIKGLAKLPEKNHSIRQELAELENKHGRNYLYEKLRLFDPESAEVIHPNNINRIIRALEVYYITGSPISEIHRKPVSDKLKSGQYRIFALHCEREKLYENINNRVDVMLENGFIKEVENLLKEGFKIENSPALNSVGYKHIIAFLENKISETNMKTLIAQDTRNYAKRQITWFKKDKNIIWIDSTDFNENRITDEIWKML